MMAARTALEALGAIISLNAKARRLSFFGYRESPLVDQRVALSDGEQGVVDKALALRAQTRLPFWDAACVSSFEAGPVDGILRAASFHRPLPKIRLSLPAPECTPQGLAAAVATLPGPVAVCSSLDDAKRWHLPLLDFHAPPSPNNLALVMSCCRQLGLSGAIALSGKSYHCYGFEAVSRARLLDILKRSLLLAPIIDRAWVAHQLLESEAALRVTPKAPGEPPPIVVAEVA